MNIRTKYYPLAMLLALGLFADCNKDDSSSEAASRPSNAVTLDITAGSSKRTRSNPIDFDNPNKETTFNVYDEVCVSVPDQTPVIYFLDDDGNWMETDDKFLLWKDATMDFSAYYPTTDGTSLTSFTLPIDQYDDIELADYMVALDEPKKRADGVAISLELQRKTARVIVNIAGFNDQYADITTPNVFNLFIYSGAESIGGSTPVPVLPYTIGDGGVGTKYVALVIPTGAKANETFISLSDPDGYQLFLTGIPEMEEGYSYTYNLTIGKNTIKIASVEVKDWTDGGAIPSTDNDEAIAHVTGLSIYKQLEGSVYVDNKFTLYAQIEPFNATNSMVTWTSSDDDIAEIDANGVVTAKLPGEVTFTATSVDNDEVTATYTAIIKISPNSFYVGNGKYVKFAPGNLQYNPSTSDWRFADNQWDIIGDDNGYIADEYDGYIDLFGWGMWLSSNGEDGISPTNTATDDNAYLPSVTSGEFSGSSAIGSEWKTLSAAEWKYLLTGTHSNKFGIGTIHYTLGLILLPDDYETPSGITTAFEPGTTNTTYSDADWSLMEAAGAVFLPAAGYRDGTVVSSSLVGNYGYYWSGTADGSSKAGIVFFDSHDVANPETIQHSRSLGESVRLVQFLN